MAQSSNWLNSLVTNPWFSIISLMIGVLGVILSIYIHLKSKKVKRPFYAFSSYTLEPKVQKLEMSYNSHKIERLTFTNLVFWKAGKDTIHNKDIAAGDPLKIRLSGNHKILDVKLVYESDKINQFNYNIDNVQSEISFSFDYLDKDDGVIMQIVHTGKHSDFQISGTIKGAGKIKLFYDEKPIWLKKLTNIFPDRINWMTLLLSVCLNIFLLNSRIIPYKFTLFIILVIIFIMCISLIVRLIDIIYSSKYYIVSKPKYFKDFETKSWID
ncbi:hypothetical protein [Floridanema aerugineum]|uniref:Uncharacterized protein n=1 Tax=Floridaenema aerugineum BLCC-F46 TaxID=3153654 RepID=A0ABV4X643_9CYAN